jgi:hypothetical protein
MGMRTAIVVLLSAAAAACGSDSGGGGPPTGGNGGTSGSGGSAGSGGSSGSAGSSGSSGASATGGTGGSAGSAGQAGAGGSGTECTEAPSGDLWTRMAGSYTFQVHNLGDGADAYFSPGSSHVVEILPASCSLVFHGTGETFTCVWGNPAESNKNEEGTAAQGWLIQIGANEQWNSPTPGCQVHGNLEPDEVTGGFLYMPGHTYPTTFGP